MESTDLWSKIALTDFAVPFQAVLTFHFSLFHVSENNSFEQKVSYRGEIWVGELGGKIRHMFETFWTLTPDEWM